MVFSRDAKYLLMIGGVPDFRISIFDLEKEKLMNMTAKLPFKPNKFIKAEFNP